MLVLDKQDSDHAGAEHLRGSHLLVLDKQDVTMQALNIHLRGSHLLVLDKQDVTMQALNIHLRGSHLLVLDKQDSDQALNICEGVTCLYWANKM